MKKLIVLFISIFLFSASNLAGQCKMEMKGTLKIYEKKTGIDFEKGTNIVPLFSKYMGSFANYSFLESKEGEKMLMLIFQKKISKSFTIYKDNPIILYLEGGDEVSLYPKKQMEGKREGLHYKIIPCYIVNKEQLEKLASNKIVFFKIYVNAEGELKDAMLDDLGTYLDIQLENDKFRKSVLSAAACIGQ